MRVEVTDHNPQVIILLAGHFALDHVWHTINVVSFDLSADGKITLRERRLNRSPTPIRG